MPTRNRSGVTLAELLVVLIILAAVAGTVIPMVADSLDHSAQATTEASMASIRDAILGSGDQPGYFADLGTLPVSVADLFDVPSTLPVQLQTFDANTRLGWRGPYLRHSGATYAVNSSTGFSALYGADGTPTVKDSWSNPIVIQWPSFAGSTNPGLPSLYARVVSAGPDGILQTPIATPTGQFFPSRADCGDDIVLFLRVADGRP